jgi:GT2 family glycosyltransferase
VVIVGASLVLFHSRIAEVERALAGLAAQEPAVGVVRIHLNAATPDELASLRECLARHPSLVVDVTAGVENLGFAGGHNRTLTELFGSGADAVLVVNPDVELGAGALGALDDAAHAVPGPALLGPVLEQADPATLAPTGRIDSCGIRWTWDGRHFDVGQGEPLPPLPAEPWPVAGVTGACLWVTRAAWETVVERSGEFFDADFVAYREDAELGHRARLLGVPSFVVPAAGATHVRRRRGTTRGGDAFVDLLGVRNRFLIAFKYGARRPGGPVGPLLRDLVVVAAVLLVERSSLAGLREAWRLRHAMRAKGRRVRQAAEHRG